MAERLKGIKFKKYDLDEGAAFDWDYVAKVWDFMCWQNFVVLELDI